MIGLPDLAGLDAPSGPPVVLDAWAVPGAHLAVPQALVLAPGPDGTPDLLLELARPADALDGPPERGVLDLRLEAATDLDAALTRLRATDATATVRAAAFDAGWLWLAPGAVVPDELAVPAPLGGLGVGGRRWTTALSSAAAMLLRGVLEHDALVLGAVAHVELAGIAPRLPVKVRFDPAALAAAVGALAAAGSPAVLRCDLEDALRADPAALGLEVLGEVPAAARGTLLATLADLVRAEVGAPAPGTPQGGPALALTAPPAARLERDLRMPLATWRPFVLRLDPVTALRDHVAAHGVAGLVTETRMPTSQTGVHAVDVVANLPSDRVGVLALGAQLVAAPAPPERPRAVVAGVEFSPPEDRAQAVLALGPAESLGFSVAATAVLQAGDRVEVLTGTPRTHTSDWVRLDADAFPVALLTVQASPALLALARVDGRADGMWEGTPFTLPFALAAREVALAIPRGVSVVLTLRARPPDAESPAIVVGPFAGGDVRVDLHMLPGYGPQAVEVTGEGPVELQAEGADAPPVTLLLHPDEPRRFTWFAASPFAPGYRFRRAPGDPWSAARPPGAPLLLTAQQAVPA